MKEQMKKRTAGLLSLAGLGGAYFLFRGPLFRLHGMKDWSLVLFLVCAAAVLVSGVVCRGKRLPVWTFAGYALGFWAGYFFQFDYGIGLNSMWLIWGGVCLACILFGCAAERIRKTGAARRRM